MKRNINRGEVFQLEKKVLKDNSGNLKDDFLTEYTHLVIVTKANWQLKKLYLVVLLLVFLTT